MTTSRDAPVGASRPTRGPENTKPKPGLDLLLYDALAPWYDLVDPVADHAEEAADYARFFQDAVAGPCERLLELGAGAGNNAVYLQEHFQCTLTDLSAAMLAASERQNPSAEHLLGDMRSVRLERTFDAVLIHDSIVYMVTEADVRAAIETAFVHVRPGGVAIFAPDCTRETFHEVAEEDHAQDGDRALRYLAWAYDPDPADTIYVVDYAFMLRECGQVRVLHDRHVEGLFTDQTWRKLIAEAGFEVQVQPRTVDLDIYVGHVYVAHRPLTPGTRSTP